jgi:hypothetical protein
MGGMWPPNWRISASAIAVPPGCGRSFQGLFSHFRGDGFYTFSATMFMAAISGVASISFETAAGQEFLHLDLMPSNQVRIDDTNGTEFGSFARGHAFTVQVLLNINGSASTAHIVLAGSASGQRNYTVLPQFQILSRQFGAIRLWQGFPHTGGFDATNIIVTRAP